MQGLHLIADLRGCRCAPQLLADAAALSKLCRETADAAGLAVVGGHFQALPGRGGRAAGVSGALLLAGSHLAVHTRAEGAGATLDVYVCNAEGDDSRKAERAMRELVGAFDPARQHLNRIDRDATADDPQGELLLEWLNDDCAYGVRALRRLETVRSAHQTIEVVETRQFGRLFRLDGSFMTSERDEFFYHEPIVHCAAVAHDAPASALVIGGGDGGSSEELLKHPSVRRVVVAELDAEVIRISRAHLGTVHRGALDDARVDLHVGDGFDYARTSGERFDLVVLDLTDPDTPARRLYTREFFDIVKRRLAPGGALALHLGSPVFQPERVRGLLADLAACFAIVRPLGQYVPLYGSYWAMAVASDALDPCAIEPAEVEVRIAARSLGRLQLYNGDVHRALFALPNFFRALLP